MGHEVSGDSDADDEGEVVEDWDPVRRLALEKEGVVVRKLVDLKLPSKEQVEGHHVRGHFPHSNWRHMCVRAKARDMGYQTEGGKGRKAAEYYFE